MKNKIYIVTSGEYSDYHIDAVFSTQELAEDYIQQNGIDYGIEEYNLDEEIDRNTKLWRVEFDIKDGKLKDASVRDYGQDDFRDTCKVSDYFRSQCINFFVDAFKSACFDCYMTHRRNISELENKIKCLKNYRYAFYMMFAAWVIQLIAFILK